MTITRFQQRDVQAVRWDGTNEDDVNAILDGFVFYGRREASGGAYYTIVSDEGVSEASVGDYIVKNPDGTIRVCADVDFAAGFQAGRSVAHPGRAVNTDFIVSTDRDALVYYTFFITCALTLTGTQVGTVNLLVNGAAVGSTVSQLLNAALVPLVTLTISLAIHVATFVPAGSTVRLQQLGTGTVDLVTVTEVLL